VLDARSTCRTILSSVNCALTGAGFAVKEILLILILIRREVTVHGAQLNVLLCLRYFKLECGRKNWTI
jgi:lipoate-protein ligase B